VKALDPLAVAERDILALGTARENRAALRRLYERERASPFQSTRTAPAPRPHRPAPPPHRGRRRPHTSPASSLRPPSLIPRTAPSRHGGRDSARHRTARPTRPT